MHCVQRYTNTCRQIRGSADRFHGSHPHDILDVRNTGQNVFSALDVHTSPAGLGLHLSITGRQLRLPSQSLNPRIDTQLCSGTEQSAPAHGRAALAHNTAHILISKHCTGLPAYCASAQLHARTAVHRLASSHVQGFLSTQHQPHLNGRLVHSSTCCTAQVY